MYINSTVEQSCVSEEWSEDSSVVSAEDKRINEEEEEEEKPPETVPLQPLSSGISLFSLRDPNKDDKRWAERRKIGTLDSKVFSCMMLWLFVLLQASARRRLVVGEKL